MKKLLIYIFFCYPIISFTQTWETSLNCNVNVNDLEYLNVNREPVINATVKLDIDGYCSGTLINRNTSDNEVGYYILLAKHCIDDIDFSVSHSLYFNYQSPDEETYSTEISNRGIQIGQSTALTDNRHEYHHETLLRKVSDFIWGDLALIEVLTPIPVHFNYTYAGWNPSRFVNGIHDGLPAPPPPKTKMVGVHHPRGDIKKISGVNHIEWQENPIATDCYTITTIIDVLFGWIWGNTVSTSVICNYLDNPWLVVPPYGFQYGIVENGSSGSGIYSYSNSLFGVLSGSVLGCDAGLATTYGKLHANYSNASIKNTLNPNHNVWVDLTGLESRKIDCYDNLILPGAEGVSGNYFPASHYQYENEIVLSAINNIETTQSITIYPDADYTFQAGNSIVIGEGFNVLDGARFHAKIQGCNSNKSQTPNIESQVLQEIQEIDLPEKKEFDIKKYLNSDQVYSSFMDISMLTFPNPVSDKLNISIYSSHELTELRLEIYNLESKICFSELLKVNNLQEYQVDISGLKSGVYILKLFGNKYCLTEKIIKL